MNKNDLRYQKTELAIIEEFCKCVNRHGFEKTTIARICDNARISRNTFYLHYADKYELVDKMFADLKEKMCLSLTDKMLWDLKENDIANSVEWMFNEVDKNRKYISVLLKCSKDKMNHLLEIVFIDTPLSKMYEDYNPESLSMESRIRKSYISSAMVGFTDTWLKDYKSLSKDNIINIMNSMADLPVQLYFKSLIENEHLK